MQRVRDDNSRPCEINPNLSQYAMIDPPAFFPQAERMANTFGHLFRITTWANPTAAVSAWWSMAARPGSN